MSQKDERKKTRPTSTQITLNITAISTLYRPKNHVHFACVMESQQGTHPLNTGYKTVDRGFSAK
jgi:hypothetical protein